MLSCLNIVLFCWTEGVEQSRDVGVSDKTVGIVGCEFESLLWQWDLDHPLATGHQAPTSQPCNQPAKAIFHARSSWHFNTSAGMALCCFDNWPLTGITTSAMLVLRDSSGSVLPATDAQRHWALLILGACYACFSAGYPFCRKAQGAENVLKWFWLSTLLFSCIKPWKRC